MLQYLMAVTNFRNEEEGQGLVEYALIIALIAIVCVGALELLGGGVEGVLSGITGSLGTTGSGT